ncbi:hypothetical protein AMS68_006279 [Peltaster fructicola]|uniref:PIPK domain-containing protein n=1 Tax=Peltaster fructicola TaxID=286661 RepID=A0A6H0Y153_9PEZI|nr:hypothetical protein AMS68_006279 [Peltaster fructicola]
MAPRNEVIAESIVHAIREPQSQHSIMGRLPRYFSTYWLDFIRVREDIFKSLRAEWHVEEADYQSSFTADKNSENALESMGDMGFSGSTFYTTADSTYLVKSVPREFEHSFFRDDLLEPYAKHMKKNQGSLLVRIMDFLETSQSTVGTTIGLAPSHHIIMENIRYGEGKGDDEQKWESYDLKPLSYFYPERDVAGGAFASKDAMDKLADEFNEKLILSLDEAEDLKAQLEKDTALLARCNAVDYSLYLVRIPAAVASDKSSSDAPIPPAEPPFVPPGPPSWRTGMKSADGKWVYRAAVLDFFWAKHKLTAKIMTGLINTYNLVDKQGPMSITTNASEYRERFLKMCKEMLEVKQDEIKPQS